MSAETESPGWDFFIAHASADAGTADQLYELLTASGARVFLDFRCVKLGDDWDRRIRAAQEASLISVILVSSKTDEAY